MIVTPAGGSTFTLPPGERAPAEEPIAWYAFRTRIGREFRVRQALEDAGTEQFLPVYEIKVAWSDREKTRERVFFPGYIFARCSQRAARRAPADINFVMEVLGLDDTPFAIPASQIDALQRAIASRGAVECCPYVAGSLVRVKTGPLAGISGVVRSVEGETLLTVGIEFLRRAILVRIDAADLEAADATKV